jgi:hypothetical protein
VQVVQIAFLGLDDGLPTRVGLGQGCVQVVQIAFLGLDDGLPTRVGLGQGCVAG